MEKKKREYVWVVWDPLYERVVCVHKKLQDDCKECRKIRKERENAHGSIGAYFLESKKFMIK